VFGHYALKEIVYHAALLKAGTEIHARAAIGERVGSAEIQCSYARIESELDKIASIAEKGAALGIGKIGGETFAGFEIMSATNLTIALQCNGRLVVEQPGIEGP
jgi:hypothetical protein